MYGGIIIGWDWVKRVVLNLPSKTIVVYSKALNHLAFLCITFFVRIIIIVKFAWFHYCILLI